MGVAMGFIVVSKIYFEFIYFGFLDKPFSICVHRFHYIEEL